MLDLSRLSSLGEAILDTVVTYKSNDALIEADRHRENARFTYGELCSGAQRFASLLGDHRFAPGDRLAIVMQNQSKWIVAAIGGLWAGATLVPIDYKSTATEQLALLAHCRPRALVIEYPAWLAMKRGSDAALADVVVFVTEAPADADLGGAFRFEQPPRGSFQYVPRDRDDVACIVYSSGTGGTPKGCMLTHANYLEQAQVLARMFPLAETDRYFSVLPTNHAIDFMCGFVIPLLSGAAIVHQRTLRPQFLRASMKRYGITHMALVPTILKNLEKRIRERLDDLPHWQRRIVDTLTRVNKVATARKPRQELSRWLLKPIHDEFGGSLRLIFAGGSFIDRRIAEFFYDLGIPVVIGYGLTEASTVVTVNDLEPFRGDSVGAPVPGLDVEVRNPNEDGVGEVWVKGPTVMRGYLDAPELTAETIVDGWLRTGDLGSIDLAGHLKLVGRAKNMIVTEGGKNIYPEDIEVWFEGLPDCEEYCVFAANYIWPTGKLSGEQLVVVVRPTGSTPTRALTDELVARNRKLADFKRLRGYVLEHAEFPATASLKVKRTELAERLRSRTRADAIVEFDHG